MIHQFLLPIAIGVLLFVFIWWLSRLRTLRRASTTDFNAQEFELLPQLFPVIGILATFIGVALGFKDFDMGNVEKSLPALITGLKSAFWASAVGILFLIVSSWLLTRYQRKYNYQKASDETLELRQTNALLQELMQHLTAARPNKSTSEGGLTELRQVNESLQTITQHLADDRAAKNLTQELLIFRKSYSENVLNQATTQKEHLWILEALRSDFQHLFPEIKTILTEIAERQKAQQQQLTDQMGRLQVRLETGFSALKKTGEETAHKLQVLSTKIAAPGTEMLEKVLEGMKSAMQDLMKDMRDVFSENLRREMTALSQSISGSMDALQQFPDQVNKMAAGLELAVSGAGKEISTFTGLMAQVQGAQKALSEREAELAARQEQVLSQAGRILSQMATFKEAVSGAWENIDAIKDAMSTSAKGLERSVEVIEAGIIQMQLANEETNQSAQKSIAQQEAVLKALQNAVDTTLKMPENFVLQFRVINDGLKGIFTQIDSGLKSYQKEVRESINNYLDKFTHALSSANGELGENVRELRESNEQLVGVIRRAK